jgi:MYXO-CTERM domain-containing protein
VPLLPSRLVHVRPLQALQPRTKYEVLAKGADGVASVRYAFTTGDAPATELPAAPSNLRVRAYRPPSPQNSCAPSGPFVVDINAQAAANASFYLLQVQVGDHFESVDYASTPSFTVSSNQLPSPVYRIQAVSLAGAFADEGSLSMGRATEEQEPPTDDGDDDRSACSAAPGDAGSALALLLGGVGWALWQRRRKPSSLRHLARGDHHGIAAR